MYYYRAEISEDSEYYGSMQLDPAASFHAVGVRPVKLLWEEKSNFVNTPIVRTYGETSVICPFGAPEGWAIDDAADKGQFNVIAESKKIRYDGTTPYYSRIIACGSENLFIRDFLSATNYNNAEVAISVFNTISGNAGESIKITPKSFTATTYEINASQQGGIAIVFIVIIPVIIIITGIVVWIRRKRL